MISVKDHNKFRLFCYTNYPNDTFTLGNVLLKEDEESTEIGVVIQTFDDGDCRTDMWGNCSPSEVRSATIEDIKTFRPELLQDLLLN